MPDPTKQIEASTEATPADALPDSVLDGVAGGLGAAESSQLAEKLKQLLQEGSQGQVSKV